MPGAEVPLRLWHQSMTELEHLPDYRAGLEQHAADVLGGRAEVHVHGLQPGSYGGAAPSDVLGYPYAYHVVLEQAIDAARRAEREGYDGFVVGSFSEPFLHEVRSAVDVPVASMAEATLLVACSLGTRTALVANAPSVRGLVRKAVDAHRLGARVATVTSLDPPLTETGLAASGRAQVAAAFVEHARGLVADGADVVVPAEGVLAEIVRDEGVLTIDDAPVVDSLAATWLHAEMLVRLARVTGVVTSRAAHPRASDEVVEALLAARAARLRPGGRTGP